jgi:hypothetical protein
MERLDIRDLGLESPWSKANARAAAIKTAHQFQLGFGDSNGNAALAEYNRWTALD